MRFNSPMKIAHKIRLKRLKGAHDPPGLKKWKPIKLVHKIKLKPMKGLKRLFDFWL